MPTNEDMATLSILATDVGLSKSKLEWWSKMGLISPSVTLTTGTKLFPRKLTVQRLKEIIRLKDAGRSLDEIKIKLA